MGGKAGKLVQNVAGDQHRDTVLPVELQDQLPYFDDALGVKAVDRLVQHQKIRISRQRHGDPQPLAHTQRKMLHLLFSGTLQPHQPQQLRNALSGGHSQHKILLAEVFLRRHVRVGGGRFHHGAHSAAAAADPRVRVPDTVKREAAACRLLQAADQADQRGLACAIPPHKAIDRPLRDTHGKAVQRGKTPVTLGQGAGFQHIFH